MLTYNETKQKHKLIIAIALAIIILVTSISYFQAVVFAATNEDNNTKLTADTSQRIKFRAVKVQEVAGGRKTTGI